TLRLRRMRVVTSRRDGKTDSSMLSLIRIAASRISTASVMLAASMRSSTMAGMGMTIIITAAITKAGRAKPRRLNLTAGTSQGTPSAPAVGGGKDDRDGFEERRRHEVAHLAAPVDRPRQGLVLPDHHPVAVGSGPQL